MPVFFWLNWTITTVQKRIYNTVKHETTFFHLILAWCIIYDTFLKYAYDFLTRFLILVQSNLTCILSHYSTGAVTISPRSQSQWIKSEAFEKINNPISPTVATFQQQQNKSQIKPSAYIIGDTVRPFWFNIITAPFINRD